MNDPRRFAQAVSNFCQSAGWMMNRQLGLDKAAADLPVPTDHNPDDDFEAQARRRAAEMAADIGTAWDELQQCRIAVKVAATTPAHAIGGLPPEEWRHAILCEVDEAAELLGGKFTDTPKMGRPSEGERERLAQIVERLRGQRLREIENLSDHTAPPKPPEEWTLQFAADLYAKDSELKPTTAKTRLDRACKQDKIPWRRDGMNKMLDAGSVALFILRERYFETATDPA